MVLLRPVTRTKISTETFGHPVYDWIVANTPAAWVTMTLQNGWVTFGSGRPPTRYRKQGDMVFLQVAVKSGASGTAIATLPAGYRPPYTLDFFIRTGGVNSNFNVNADGTLVPFVGAGGDTTIVCNNIMFPLT